MAAASDVRVNKPDGVVNVKLPPSGQSLLHDCSLLANQMGGTGGSPAPPPGGAPGGSGGRLAQEMAAQRQAKLNAKALASDCDKALNVFATTVKVDCEPSGQFTVQDWGVFWTISGVPPEHRIAATMQAKE